MSEARIAEINAELTRLSTERDALMKEKRALKIELNELFAQAHYDKVVASAERTLIQAKAARAEAEGKGPS